MHFLLCFYAFSKSHGEFHFEFAIEHLMTLTFEPICVKHVRFYFHEFRHLHETKYRANEHDAWKAYLM